MIKAPEWRSERTVALFLLGSIAISPPFLAIFALDTAISGVPLLYAYLFVVWGGLIGLLAVLSSAGKDDGPAGAGAETPSTSGLLSKAGLSPKERPPSGRDD